MIKLNIFGQNDMHLSIEGGIGDLSYSLKYGLRTRRATFALNTPLPFFERWIAMIISITLIMYQENSQLVQK